MAKFYASKGAKPYYDPGSGASYSTVVHTRPWVYYQGTSTTVPITVLGRRSLPENCHFFLQRRGWRTGLLGWTFGAWVGGTIGKEMDVTPEQYGSWEDDVEPARRQQYDTDIMKFIDSGVLPKDHKALDTDFIHIPAAAGNGYFRILIYHPTASMLAPIAATTTFRVGSLSLSSVHPRGASIVTIIPEVALEVAWVVATTLAWTGFFSALPFLTTAQMMPFTKTWGNWAMKWAYKLTGGEWVAGRLKERYHVGEKKVKAEESVNRLVPFGSMGVRTAYDLEEDARKGRDGMAFKRV